MNCLCRYIILNKINLITYKWSDWYQLLTEMISIEKTSSIWMDLIWWDRKILLVVLSDRHRSTVFTFWDLVWNTSSWGHIYGKTGTRRTFGRSIDRNNNRKMLTLNLVLICVTNLSIGPGVPVTGCGLSNGSPLLFQQSIMCEHGLKYWAKVLLWNGYRHADRSCRFTQGPPSSG